MLKGAFDGELSVACTEKILALGLKEGDIVVLCQADNRILCKSYCWVFTVIDIFAMNTSRLAIQFI